jgi:HEAT repeat protein
MDAPALISVLTDAGSPEFKKAKACQRVGELGAKEAVPALSALLADEHLSVYARYGLEPIADPSADDALRTALSKLKGKQLIGVINSIGKRRDAKASTELASMMYGSDVDVASAAAAASGSIGGPSSVKELKTALARTKGMTRMAVADASLVCAERLLADGKRDEALALYTSLSASDVPKAARLAAMHGIIREETSINRR